MSANDTKQSFVISNTYKEMVPVQYVNPYDPGCRDRNRRRARSGSATRLRPPFSLYLISKDWQLSRT